MARKKVNPRRRPATSESLSSGFVNVNDLLRTLLEETKINLMKDGGTGGQT